MNSQKLTTEQMKKSLDEILRMGNDNETKTEKKMALLQLKCRFRQKAYYEANDWESIIEEELRLLDELERLTKEEPGENFLPRARARMKVIASTCMVFFRRAGVSLANIDTLTVAKLIGFLSGYSENSIRLYLKNETSFLPGDMDAMKAQALLMAMGINDKIVL